MTINIYTKLTPNVNFVLVKFNELIAQCSYIKPPLILVDPSTYHLYASPLELVGRPNEYDRSSRVVSDLHWGGLLGD